MLKNVCTDMRVIPPERITNVNRKLVVRKMKKLEYKKRQSKHALKVYGVIYLSEEGKKSGQ